MSLAERNQQPFTIPFEQFRFARDVINAEATALQRLATNIPAGFNEAVQILCDCQGAVIVTGIGKAGWIGQKLSATMASTGTRSHYVHPSEAMHGDLGRIGANDVILVLSNSGETGEVLQLLPTFKKTEVPVVSIVGSGNSTLAAASTIALAYGKVTEACSLGLAPSTSTTVMLALGDALALVTSRAKGFRPIDFAKHHPGGCLGRKLSTVNEVMRPIDQCRVANESDSVRSTLVNKTGTARRRSGAMLLTNDNRQLTGIFTDSDLAKILEREDDHLLNESICSVMTSSPKSVLTGSKTILAVEILACNNISELPVVDHQGRPVGVIDITDVIGLLPRK